jgi:predicted MFS family arabinose efflux permease
MEEEIIKLPRRPGLSHILRNKDFLFLWFSQLVSQLSDRFLLYVLIIFAYHMTKTNLGVSLPMLAYGVPAVLFGPAAGVFVDRWNKKYVMVISGILRGLLIFFIIPFVNYSLVFIFLISFLIFAVAQFFTPAEMSSIPSLVNKEDLIAANSLFMLTLMTASVIGIGMAAPLTNFFGTQFVLLAAAILYLSSALATFMISLKHRKKQAEGSVFALIKELLAGFEFIRRKPLIYYSLIKLFFATSVLAIISVLAVGFSEKILGIGAKNFGYLIFSAGAGMFLGGLFLSRFGHRFKKGTLVIVGFLLAGASLILLSQLRDIVLVFIAIFFLGLGNAFVVAPLQTILHERVPRAVRGRVFGVQNMMLYAAFTFPVVIFGEIADLIGLQTVIMILGAFVLISGILDRYVFKFQEV